MNRLTVSVSICTYNGERYLKQQMDSILKQTRLPDQIVICDDGSSDRTIEILQGYAEHKSCDIKIIQNEKNLGVTGNFEKCINMCDGDIIFLCDQDDFWQESKIETELKAFGDENVGLVFTNAHIVDADGRMYGHKLWDASRCSGKIVSEITEGNAFRIFLRKNFATGGTMAFRKECIKDIKIPEGWVHDHFIALIAAARYKIRPLDECLIYYRQHDEQQIGGAKDRFFKKVVLRLTSKKNIHRKYSAKIESLEELKRADFFTNTQITELEDFGKLMDDRNHFISLPFYKRFFKILLGLNGYLKYVDGFYDAVSDLLRV